MESFGVWLKFLLPVVLLLFVPASIAQLSSSERRVLFQVQQLLEYPQVLQGWNNWTNFCFLPQSPSLVVICSGNHITELTIVGNRTHPSKISKASLKSLPNPQITLSQRFSIDSFFTVLTKLSNLKKLSLVSLGLWGPLSAKIDRFDSLEVLNISSNFISGTIPPSITTFKNLKSLVLADNIFNGSIPDLKGLEVLEELDLSDNPLGPKFPSLSPSLVRIKFRNMSLRYQIPPNLIRFNLLQVLDVSSNQLQGPIPSYLFSLPSIQYLNLGKNQLSGALQPSLSCHGSLSFVDFSSNLLIGKLPSCLGSNSRNRTVIIMLNCLSNTTSKYQRPQSFCQKQALAVDPPAVKRKQQSTIKLSLVLSIIGGVVATVCLLGLLICFMFRRLERNRAKEYKCDSFVFERNPIRASVIAVDSRQVPRPMRMVSLGLPPYNVFTLEEIEDATNNFDAANLVGEGFQSHGQLYKGWLRDGSAVLVKCLKLKQKHSLQSLHQHMEVISKLRHRHLISVVGHCIVTYQDHPNTASTTVFIVLENVADGSLRDHLRDWRKKDILKWPQRMSISMSIAKGVQYLHAAGITGNDLKIEHILLDESLTAKISSYNISFPSKVGSESPLNGHDTPNHKSSTNTDDIYQLGVILLEIITGRQINAQTEIHELKLELEMSLAESPSKLGDVTDPSIRGTFAYDSLKTVAQITLNCLNEESSQRPSIEDILWHMQYSVQVQEGWTSSGNLSAKF